MFFSICRFLYKKMGGGVTSDVVSCCFFFLDSVPHGLFDGHYRPNRKMFIICGKKNSIQCAPVTKLLHSGNNCYSSTSFLVRFILFPEIMLDSLPAHLIWQVEQKSLVTSGLIPPSQLRETFFQFNCQRKKLSRPHSCVSTEVIE